MTVRINNFKSRQSLNTKQPKTRTFLCVQQIKIGKWSIRKKKVNTCNKPSIHKHVVNTGFYWPLFSNRSFTLNISQAINYNLYWPFLNLSKYIVYNTTVDAKFRFRTRYVKYIDIQVLYSRYRELKTCKFFFWKNIQTCI